MDVSNIVTKLNDAKLKDKFSEDERKQIEWKIDEVFKWVNDNPAAFKEEYDAKAKEIEAILNPIMQKIYQQIGEAPGGMSFLLITLTINIPHGFINFLTLFKNHRKNAI